MPGTASPMHRAITRLPRPEKIPLMVVICTELLALSMRVQLFSKPQQTAAPRTSRDPQLNWNAPSPSKEIRMLASVTSTIASHSRLDSTSRNTSRAISEVATISKLFSKDALAEPVCRRPNIKRIGAAISSTTIPTV